MAFTPTPGTGDLTDVNPQFVDPANLDFSLQPSSPCIGSGKDGFDRGAVWFSNRPRPVSNLNYLIEDSSTVAQIEWTIPTMMLDSTAITDPVTVRILRNDSLVSETSGLNPGSSGNYSEVLPRPGKYEYTVSVTSNSGVEGIRRKTAYRWGGGLLDGIVVWSLDPTLLSEDALIQTLGEMGYSKEIFVANDPNAYDLTQDVDAVFVFLGIQPNYYLLGEGGSNRLITYLSNGGNVYLEGGDFWSDPLQQALAVHQFFHIDPIGQGGSDLTQVQGVPGSLMDGLQFSYMGMNQSIDDITNQTDSELIMRNPADGNGCAVAYNGYLYRTIGASFQFGGLQDGGAPNTKREYMERVFGFFNIPVGIGDGPAAGTVPQNFQLKQNYPNPFNNSTSVEFYLPTDSRVELQVYNPLGQQVAVISQGWYSGGWHRFSLKADSWSSGVYFYRVRWITASGAHLSRLHKMVLLK